ncbi:MAG: type II secretion system protein, partial [Bacteroidota bacterium]
MSRCGNLAFKRGFSLIELLVSVSIYIVVITMAVGTLLVLIDANAKAQNMQDVMTNLTFAIDSMTREVRTGRGYYCSDTDPGVSLSEFAVNDCAA